MEKDIQTALSEEILKRDKTILDLLTACESALSLLKAVNRTDIIDPVSFRYIGQSIDQLTTAIRQAKGE